MRYWWERELGCSVVDSDTFTIDVFTKGWCRRRTLNCSICLAIPWSQTDSSSLSSKSSNTSGASTGPMRFLSSTMLKHALLSSSFETPSITSCGECYLFFLKFQHQNSYRKCSTTKECSSFMLHEASLIFSFSKSWTWRETDNESEQVSWALDSILFLNCFAYILWQILCFYMAVLQDLAVSIRPASGQGTYSVGCTTGTSFQSCMLQAFPHPCNRRANQTILYAVRKLHTLVELTKTTM